MAVGFDAKIPLYYDDTDGFYGLNKTIKTNTQQKIKMLLLTQPGERVMLPTYGVGLRQYLFEHAPEKDIINAINAAVERWLPEISILTIRLQKGTPQIRAISGHKNALEVTLVYLVKATRSEETLTLIT